MAAVPAHAREADRLLATLPTPIRAIGRTLLQLVRKNAPELKEGVKWGNPVWEGRANAICLMVYADHVNLGFFRGAELSPQHALLTGTGAGMRHVSIRDLRAAKNPALVPIIRDAVRLDLGRPS